MTEQPEPIRKSSLPTIPAPEWEFHTWFPHPDGGGDMVPGQRQRGVLVRRRVSCGDWEPVRPDRWADEPPTDARAVPAGQTPATDRAEVRERIAEKLAAADGWRFANGVEFASMSDSLTGHYRGLAEAVLSVLPASTDRATVRCASCEHEAQYHDADGRCWFTVEQGVPGRDAVCSCQLRRTADEAASAVVVRRATDETQGEAVCGCGHGRAYHDFEYGGPRCRLCPERGEWKWAHAFTAAVGAQQPTETRP